MENILVVEDEYSVRENIIELLVSEGYEVIEAKDGIEAYNLAVSKYPDLIISDIRMPKMNGIELLKHLQENPLTSSIPFVFLTAKVELNDIREGMTTGADDYIPKPFKADDVLKAISARLKKKKQYLETVEEMRNTLIRKIPHEFRTPLVGILGFSELLENDVETLSEETIKEYAERINRSGKRLHRRIEKFIRYSELSAESSSKKILTNKNEFIVELDPELYTGMIIQWLEENNRAGDLIINLEKARVSLSSDYLEVLINELVENAVKFSELGTKIEVKGWVEANNYKMLFKDYGIGVNHAKIDEIKILHQFTDEKDNKEGLGFGLAIVALILKYSNGSMKINSELNKYTSIEIILPLAI